MDITVTIQSPDIVQAFTALARALTDAGGEKSGSGPVLTKPEMVSPVPVSAPPPVAPVTPAPAITVAEIARAGAALLTREPAKLPALNGLLQKYGVASAQQLRPEQAEGFAAEMRALGAEL